jgi:hypothetical protein
MVAAMNRILFAALALAAASFASAAGAAERRYSLTDFDRIQIEGPYEVTLATGRSSGARATGSPEALERVTVEVQGRTLHIRRNRNGWGGYPGQAAGTVRIEATTQNLRAALVSGSGGLAVDSARGLRVDLSVSGSGRLSVAGASIDNLYVGLLGAGRITVAGTAKQLHATLQGTGDLAGEGLRVDDAQVTAETSGTISFAAVRSASVRSTGAGDVVVTGRPACTVETLGSGTVRCGSAR